MASWHKDIAPFLPPDVAERLQIKHGGERVRIPYISAAYGAARLFIGGGIPMRQAARRYGVKFDAVRKAVARAKGR